MPYPSYELGCRRNEGEMTWSRRDLMKSSPVRSAGLTFSYATRPGRDDRSLLAFAQLRATKPSITIVPGGTDTSFLHHFPALRTGLLSSGPSGTKSSFAYLPQPNRWFTSFSLLRFKASQLAEEESPARLRPGHSPPLGKSVHRDLC